MKGLYFYQQNNNPNQVLTVVFIYLKDYNLISLLEEQNNLCYMVFFCVFVLKDRQRRLDNDLCAMLIGVLPSTIPIFEYTTAMNKVTNSNHYIALINCKDLEHAWLNDFSLTCVILQNCPFH